MCGIYLYVRFLCSFYVVIVVKVCDTNYFIPRGSMLDFQIVKGYSCLDYMVLVGVSYNLENANDPTWLCLL